MGFAISVSDDTAGVSSSLGVQVPAPENVLRAARDTLLLASARGTPDPWLFEHSERVMRISLLLGDLQELRADPPDPTALATAALFHDAGWAVQVRDGVVASDQVLSRPTGDAQRELSANELDQRCAGMLPPETLLLAGEAIRQCNLRTSTLPEAQVLADAENLDEIGLIYVLRQFRIQNLDGRTVVQLVENWNRQRQYRYWEARIERLRFRISRQLAQKRLAEIERWMETLQSEALTSDLKRLFDDLGQPPPPARRGSPGAG